MVSLVIQSNLPKVSKDARIAPEIYKRAYADALNRTAANVRTEVARHIVKTLSPGYTLTELKGGTTTPNRIGKPSRATPTRLASSIDGRGRPTNLRRFKPQPYGAAFTKTGRRRKKGGEEVAGRASGYSAEPIRGKRQRFPGAFEMNTASSGSAGRLIVWRRKSGKIRGIYGPSVAAMMLFKSTLKVRDKTINAKFEDHMRSRLLRARARSRRR